VTNGGRDSGESEFLISRKGSESNSVLTRRFSEARLAYSSAEYHQVLSIVDACCASFRSTDPIDSDTARRLRFLGAWAALALGEMALARHYAAESREDLATDDIHSQPVLVLAAAIDLAEGKFGEVIDQLVPLGRGIATGPDHELFGEFSTTLGTAYWRLGAQGSALHCYEDAVAAFRRTENPARLARAIVNMALPLRKAGHFARAREVMFEAKSLRGRVKAPRAEVVFQVNLSVLEYVCGDYRKSCDCASEGIAAASSLGLVEWHIRALLSRARACIELGDRRIATADLSSALGLSHQRGYGREEAAAHEFLGDLARSLDDWATARFEWEQALAIGERIAPRGDVTGEPLRRLAEAALHFGDIPQALSFGRRAYDVNTSCGDRKERASTLRVLGDIALARGRRIAARRAYNVSVNELSTMGAMGELAHSERALATLDALEHGTESGDSAKDLPTTVAKRPRRRAHLTPTSPIAFAIPSRGWEFLTLDAVLLRLIESIREVAPTDETVLLLGETGTGKELLARFLHETSGRTGAFVATNASAIPDALIESELFGHVRGAFTGALSDRKGLLEAAHGGSFFLDEIGDLPTVLQAKLLRTLEEREVKRVGATEARRIDVRFVAATNRDLKQEVQMGRFRQDLYFRLAVHEFEIPPLRRRGDDVPLLARAFLERSLRKRGKAPGAIEADVEDAISAYRWPGNVRELANEMQRVASRLGDGEPVRLEHLSTRVRAALKRAGGAGAGAANQPNLFDDVALMERSRIEEALAATDGNQARAGEILGLSRQALHYKLLKYGLVVSKQGAARPSKDSSKK